jgi:hypothetical protein
VVDDLGPVAKQALLAGIGGGLTRTATIFEWGRNMAKIGHEADRAEDVWATIGPEGGAAEGMISARILDVCRGIPWNAGHGTRKPAVSGLPGTGLPRSLASPHLALQSQI